MKELIMLRSSALKTPGTVYPYLRLLGMKSRVLELSLHLGTAPCRWFEVAAASSLWTGTKSIKSKPCSTPFSSILIHRDPAALVTMYAHPKRSRPGAPVANPTI